MNRKDSNQALSLSLSLSFSLKSFDTLLILFSDSSHEKKKENKKKEKKKERKKYHGVNAPTLNAYPRKKKSRVGVHVYLLSIYIFLLRAHGPIIELARAALNARRSVHTHTHTHTRSWTVLGRKGGAEGEGERRERERQKKGTKKGRRGKNAWRKGSNLRVSVYAPREERRGGDTIGPTLCRPSKKRTPHRVPLTASSERVMKYTNRLVLFK